MRLKRLAAMLAVSVAVAAAFVWWVTRPPARSHVLVPDGAAEFVLMDFSRPFPLTPPPPGWLHRTFWTRPAATFAFAEKDGVAALKVETRASASMLFRHVNVDLARYPVLAWRWFIEQPIESPLDERTREGDDHPARFFVHFLSPTGEARNMEIIWGNTVLKAGDYKFLGTFPHYVANGGQENVGRWHDERIDLAAIYRRLWPQDGNGSDAAPHLVDIAIFCDSDETGARSIAYFTDVKVVRAE